MQNCLNWYVCRWMGGFPHIGGVWRTMFAPTGEVQSNTVTNMNFSRLENHDYQSGFVQYCIRMSNAMFCEA